MGELVTRDQWAAYMSIGSVSSTVFNLIGEGFTQFSESKNPKEYSRKYVHERTERTDVTGYAPSVAYSADIYTEDTVLQEFIKISDEELVGTSAQRSIISVNLFEPAGSANTFVAYKRTYAIIPDSKGDGDDALIYTGNIKAVGDSVKGTFNTETKTFNATAAATLTFVSGEGATTGKTAISDISPSLTAGDSYVIKMQATEIALPGAGDVVDHTWTVWDGTSEITAVDGYYIAIAEINASSQCVRAGQQTIVSAD